MTCMYPPCNHYTSQLSITLLMVGNVTYIAIYVGNFVTYGPMKRWAAEDTAEHAYNLSKWRAAILKVYICQKRPTKGDLIHSQKRPTRVQSVQVASSDSQVICVYMYVCMCVCMYVCMYVCVCVCVCELSQQLIYIYTCVGLKPNLNPNLNLNLNLNRNLNPIQARIQQAELSQQLMESAANMPIDKAEGQEDLDSEDGEEAKKIREAKLEGEAEGEEKGREEKEEEEAANARTKESGVESAQLARCKTISLCVKRDLLCVKRDLLRVRAAS